MIPNEIPHFDDLPFHVRTFAEKCEGAAELLRGLNLEFNEPYCGGLDEDARVNRIESEKKSQAESIWTEDVLPILESLR